MTVINTFLEQVKRDMISEQRRKGITSSGRSIASLNIKGDTLVGIGYWEFLFRGKGVKTFPPAKAIDDWLKVKPELQHIFRDEKGRFLDRKQIGFLIRRKIAREGTEIFKDPRKGVDIEVIINRHSTELAEGVAEDIAQTFAEDLNKIIIG